MESVAALTDPVEATPARVILRQVWAAMTLSTRRLSRSVFMFVSLGLCGLPLLVAFAINVSTRQELDLNWVHTMYEVELRLLFLHFIIFFIANIVGFAVTRQDNEEQTLHYLFMAPVGRWALVAGKFGAFLAIGFVLCFGSLWLNYLALAVPNVGLDATVRDLVAGGRLWILVRETLVLVYAMAVYGSIAMLAGAIFKSGFYALVLLGWESALPYLPSSAKMLTVMHYLHSLLPERPLGQSKMFELLGEPSPLWASLLVPLGVSVVFVGLSMLFFHFRECKYAES